MDDEKMKMMKEKCDFFLEEQIKVHINLLDKGFLNGKIIKKMRDDPTTIYWFEDRILGEVMLFLREIYDIKPFNEEDKEK